jgi:hypothetical protein
MNYFLADYFTKYFEFILSYLFYYIYFISALRFNYFLCFFSMLNYIIDKIYDR